MEFDRAEVKFDIAPDGTPLGVYYKESKDSNKLADSPPRALLSLSAFCLYCGSRLLEFLWCVSYSRKSRSNRRYTYEEAQEIIETGRGDYAEAILTLDRIAKALRKKRFDNGAMEFDRAEVKFDNTGHSALYCLWNRPLWP